MGDPREKMGNKAGNVDFQLTKLKIKVPVNIYENQS